MWDLRLHSHYCCQIGYPTPHTASSGDTSGQKGLFRLYLSHQHSGNLSNNVWNIQSCQDLRLSAQPPPTKNLNWRFWGKYPLSCWKIFDKPQNSKGKAWQRRCLCALHTVAQISHKMSDMSHQCLPSAPAWDLLSTTSMLQLVRWAPWRDWNVNEWAVILLFLKN
jgi:hypothetical protein